MKINPKIYFFSLILYCLAIFILSSIPGEELPKVDVEYSDKIVHAIVYGILFILFFYTLKNQTKNIRLRKFALEYSLLFTGLYGITDEIHQYFVPNRTCEFYDWAADFAGALIVYLGYKFLYMRRKSLITIVLLFFLGCGSSGNVSSNEKTNIGITEVESWIDLMPGIDDRKNNFGFLINLKIESESMDTNYMVKDLNVYMNNDSLYDKGYESQLLRKSASIFQYNIFQSRNEMYIKNKNNLPQEVKFSFSIYRGNNKIKTLTTPKVQIQRVY